MKNPNIAQVLKYYRKLNEISVNEVSNILKENNNYAAPKTIYGWESGQTQPDADTLMFLCDLYGIKDILQTFGYQNGNHSKPLLLTAKERRLVIEYREQKNMQLAVDRLLGLQKED